MTRSAGTNSREGFTAAKDSKYPATAGLAGEPGRGEEARSCLAASPGHPGSAAKDQRPTTPIEGEDVVGGGGSASGPASPAARRLDLTYTLTERYYVTDEALDAVKDAPDRDDALIQLFELHNGSPYGERFFYHDANPSVGIEVEEVESDA